MAHLQGLPPGVSGPPTAANLASLAASSGLMPPTSAAGLLALSSLGIPPHLPPGMKEPTSEMKEAVEKMVSLYMNLLCIILYSILYLYYTTLYYILYSILYLHYTTLYYILYSILYLHSTTLYYILYSILYLYYTTLYYILYSILYLHSTTLYYILYSSIVAIPTLPPLRHHLSFVFIPANHHIITYKLGFIVAQWYVSCGESKLYLICDFQTTIICIQPHSFGLASANTTPAFNYCINKLYRDYGCVIFCLGRKLKFTSFHHQ